MKKFISLILAITIAYLFTSCTFNESQYIRPNAKPKVNYYANEIRDRMNRNEEYTIKIFDLNIYKYYEVDKQEHSIIPEFIDALNNENYGVEIEDELAPEYKIIIEFSNEKYIINAYNEKLITVYPWDGVYPKDNISMEGVSDYYNLFKYCEYIKKVSRGFEG